MVRCWWLGVLLDVHAPNEIKRTTSPQTSHHHRIIIPGLPKSRVGGRYHSITSLLLPSPLKKRDEVAPRENDERLEIIIIITTCLLLYSLLIYNPIVACRLPLFCFLSAQCLCCMQRTAACITVNWSRIWKSLDKYQARRSLPLLLSQ